MWSLSDISDQARGSGLFALSDVSDARAQAWGSGGLSDLSDLSDQAGVTGCTKNVPSRGDVNHVLTT